MVRAIGLLTVLLSVVGFFASPALQAQTKNGNIDLTTSRGSTRYMNLALGKSVIIESPVKIGDIVIADPDVISAVPYSSTQLFLMGKQVGRANAVFLDARGKSILTLEVSVEPDVGRLASTISTLFPDSDVRVSSLNGNIVVKGSVGSAAAIDSIVDLAERFSGEEGKVVNMLSTGHSNMVMLRVRILEMNRSFLRQLGVNMNATVGAGSSSFTTALIRDFPTSQSGGLSLGGAFANSGGDSLNINLRMLELRGFTRTLAEPVLTARSGEEASVLVGGDYPVPVAQQGGVATIEFKSFGVLLNFTPVVLSKDMIYLSMTTEVSQISTDNALSLSGSTGVGGGADPSLIAVPGTNARRVRTSAELASGQSLVVAGLVQEELRETLSGLPGLMNIPILGRLFRSEEFTKRQTELVVLITPFLAEPADQKELADPLHGSSEAMVVIDEQLRAAYGAHNAERDGNHPAAMPAIGFTYD